MGCVQSYFKRAHNAGVSPSSTQESTSKQAPSEDGRVAASTQEERSITEEPESNDTSYGVEATAVRTLAATTGTVAILGTTAKTGEKKESDESEKDGVETIPEEKEEAVAVVHEEKVQNNSTPINSEVKARESVTSEEALSPTVPATEVKEETPPSEFLTVESNKTPPSESNKSLINLPDDKSAAIPSEKTEPKNLEENPTDLVVSELAKEKEEDVSKSISSERLKTNSISNTTLSSDSIAEFENNSVKQSPSADKVIESFDSSSTVEFVDTVTKDVSKVDDSITKNPARSISSDLSNKASLPVDGEKTPEVTTPVRSDDNITTTSLPPPRSEQNIDNTTIFRDTPTKIEMNEVPNEIISISSKAVQDEANANSSLKDSVLNDTNSQHPVENIIVPNSVQPLVQNDSSPQEVKSPSANDSSSPIASEDNNKAETRSPFSSDNNSSIIENGDIASPETAMAKCVAPMEEGNQKMAPDVAKLSPDLVNGISSGNVTPVDKFDTVDLKSTSNVLENTGDLKNIKNEPTGELLNGQVSDDVFGSTASDEKVVAAATTIQASFRGFHTRQTLKGNESNDTKENKSGVAHDKVNELNENSLPNKNIDDDAKNTLDETQTKTINKELQVPINSTESGLENTEDQMIAAATTIQANFRGFHARQTMKTKLDSGLPPSEETNPSTERKTPTALTPELIESVKEEVDEICKEAETIVAERCESAEGMIKGVDQVVMESKTALPSVSESVLAIRGSTSPPSVSDGGAEESLDTEDSKGEVFDPLIDSDEKAVQAATAIQATFRGFQTRKNLQKDSTEQFDSMPNYPPPAAEEEYLQSLEELPPPDFEALESSYSEDVPTEPLAPPPPLQDSMVFNEEDEDELMSLQSIKGEEADDSSPGLRQDTDSSDSSLSSAATKIQAGVRGYLTRRQIQAASGGTGTGTTSTSTNVLDSDLSQSVSRDDEGVRSAMSLEQESEVCRHRASPDPELPSVPKPIKSAGKRMSLGSNIADLPPSRQRPPLRSALSVQGPGGMASDEEVWSTLKGEMSEAATKIQSNFRGYRARKQLQREDAVQVTSSSSQATPSSGSGRESVASAAPQTQASRGSGEYHDMVVAVSPPVPAVSNEADGGSAAAQPEVGESTQPAGTEPAEMVKRHAEPEDGEGTRESTAATKIQATFRGFKARQGMRDVDRAAAKIQAGFRGYKVRKDMKKGRRSPNPDQEEIPASQPGAGSQEETAATKIQAGVRGFLVRRRNQKDQAGLRGPSHPRQPPSTVDQ